MCPPPLCPFVTKWGTLGGGDGQFITGVGAVAVDGSGNVFVADTSRIQKFTNTGTFLGTLGCTIGGSADGQFIAAFAVAVDGSGNVFVVDTYNGRIQKFACP